MSLLLFSLFTGQYIFNRSVSLPKMQMSGYANFTSLFPGVVQYREEGSFHWKGREQHFYQNRLFVIYENELLILKNDKNLLHRFHLKSDCDFPIHLQHTHSCHDDQYKVDFWIHSFGEFSISYHIFGPNKADYTITTHFQKVFSLNTSHCEEP